jgi:NarL family two-component system sensor histidine kinase YdfH
MGFFVIIFSLALSRQAEAHARAQNLLNELETAHKQLTEYALQVEELTLTTERQRMARDLHDTLAQGLAGLILQLEAADSHLSSNHPERAQDILRQAMSRARTTLADARRAIGDLREMPASPPDLERAVRQEVQRFQEMTGIPCALEIAIPLTLPDHIRENALRAVTEGLSNTARHAQAKHAAVQLALQDGWLQIEIHDDGHGFVPAESIGQAGHYGLVGLRERTRLVGGELTLESSPGAGTRIRLKLPVTGGQTG